MTFQSWRALVCTITIFMLQAFSPAWAGHEEDMQAAFAEAVKVATQGPADISLTDQARLHLPSGYVFIPRPAADRIMQAAGNPIDERFVGIVQPTSDESWTVLVEYEKSGFIKEDDAKDWNVDDLFKSLKAGTEAANEERRNRGFPEIEVAGWVEVPKYDVATHRLVWAMAARHKGEPDTAARSVNYNTYALGREGYLTLNLITAQSSIETFKPRALALLSAVEYLPGKAYADFNSSTDKVAEYGLAALVAGVAAKKLGLFAVVAAFVAKFAKLIILAVAATAGGVFKRFRGKKQDSGSDKA